jgi:hypothetical protein
MRRHREIRELDRDTQWRLDVEHHQSIGKPRGAIESPPNRLANIEIRHADKETAKKVRNEYVTGKKKK